MIQADSSTVGGRSLYTHVRGVGFRHDSPQPGCVVQHGGVDSKEGWRSMLLHRFLLPQHPHEKGFLSIAKNPGGT